MVGYVSSGGFTLAKIKNIEAEQNRSHKEKTTNKFYMTMNKLKRCSTVKLMQTLKFH